MMITGISVNAIQGVQSAFADAARAGQEIVRGYSQPTTQPPTTEEPTTEAPAEFDSDQMVKAVVDLIRAETSLKANAAMLRTADEMTGTVLDIVA